MTVKLVLAAATAALALGGAAVGVHSLTRPQTSLDPVVATAPALPEATTTLMLTVQLDAVDGVRVLQTLAKPQLGFQQPRNWARLPLQWTMRDADGAVIARGGFDPHLICLDPEHAGQPPHMTGDQIVPHIAHANLKVPALDGFDRIEFAWVGKSDDPAHRSRGLGTVAATALTIR